MTMMGAERDPEPRRQGSCFEYDVAVVKARALGKQQYPETKLQDCLDAHAADGWQLRFITAEPYRLLVTFERPAGRSVDRSR